MDEVFGGENFAAQITFKTTSGAGSFAGGTDMLAAVTNYILWFTRSAEALKYRQLYRTREAGGAGAGQYTWLEMSDGSDDEHQRPS